MIRSMKNQQRAWPGLSGILESKCSANRFIEVISGKCLHFAVSIFGDQLVRWLKDVPLFERFCAWKRMVDLPGYYLLIRPIPKPIPKGIR